MSPQVQVLGAAQAFSGPTLMVVYLYPDYTSAMLADRIIILWVV